MRWDDACLLVGIPLYFLIIYLHKKKGGKP